MGAQNEALELRANSVAMACETGSGLLAARLAADDRASKVEEENARLHCEVQALRHALFEGGLSTPHSSQTVTSAPSDETNNGCARSCVGVFSALNCCRRRGSIDHPTLVKAYGQKKLDGD